MFISAQKHLFWTGVFFHQWGDPPDWWKNTPGPKTAILGRNPNYKIVKIFILLCYFKILLVPLLSTTHVVARRVQHGSAHIMRCMHMHDAHACAVGRSAANQAS